VNWRELLVMTLLVIGALGFIFSSLGLLFTHDVFDRIQFLAPASLVGALAIALAVLVHEGFNQAGVKAVLIAFLFLWANPILSHATARAARVRLKGRWQITADEKRSMAEDDK
jgi:monovalent cation/proton antiporter MnhG/PhaG subunit